jgi:hypothetical protein
MNTENEVSSRGPWNPTEEQFAAYEERETQLAVHNLRNNKSETTLHSAHTIARAKARMTVK